MTTSQVTQKEQAINAMRNFLTDKSKSVFLLRGNEDKLKIKSAIICLSAMYKHVSSDDALYEFGPD